MFDSSYGLNQTILKYRQQFIYIIKIRHYGISIIYVENIFNNYSVNGTRLSEYFVETEFGTINEFQHPGVPTIVVYGSYLKADDR